MSASRRPAEAWGRIRLLLILGAAVLVVVVLVAGLVLAGTYAVTGAPQDGGSRSPQSIGEKLPAAPTGRDAIAAAPMLQVDRQAGAAYRAGRRGRAPLCGFRRRPVSAGPG